MLLHFSPKLSGEFIREDRLWSCSRRESRCLRHSTDNAQVVRGFGYPGVPAADAVVLEMPDGNLGANTGVVAFIECKQLFGWPVTGFLGVSIQNQSLNVRGANRSHSRARNMISETA